MIYEKTAQNFKGPARAGRKQTNTKDIQARARADVYTEHKANSTLQTKREIKHSQIEVYKVVT